MNELRFQYNMIEDDYFPSEDILNAAGSEGWRLVQITYDNLYNHWVAIFVREIHS